MLIATGSLQFSGISVDIVIMLDRVFKRRVRNIVMNNTDHFVTVPIAKCLNSSYTNTACQHTVHTGWFAATLDVA